MNNKKSAQPLVMVAFELVWSVLWPYAITSLLFGSWDYHDWDFPARALFVIGLSFQGLSMKVDRVKRGLGL